MVSLSCAVYHICMLKTRLNKKAEASYLYQLLIEIDITFPPPLAENDATVGCKCKRGI